MTPNLQQQNLANSKSINSSMKDSKLSSSELSETIDAQSGITSVIGRFGSSQFLKRAQSLSPTKLERKMPMRNNFSTQQLGT